MKVKTHKLIDSDGSPVAFEATPNKRGKLKGGKPRFIIIHFTANGSARGTVRFFQNPDSRVSAHLVVGHDGTITQMVPFNERAWHAGRSSWMELSGLNSYAVGIEIVNWGGLIGSRGNWKTWTGKSIADDRVVEAAHRNNPGHSRGWEVFDEEQFDAVAAIVRALGVAYGIGPAEVLGHDDIAPHRKTDPGPAWDMARFRSMIAGRDEEGPEMEEFVVTARNGLNMRTGPGIQHDAIKLLKRNTTVSMVEMSGLWWLVAEVKNGVEGVTGWVHSNWLSAK